MCRGLLIILVTSFLFGACVSNKKVQYLQHDDVNVKDGLVKDSTVRTYSITDYQYRIQPNDILSVNFESLTQGEFDFFKKESVNNNQVGNSNGALLIGELVDNNGSIEFPVVGKVKVNGLTIFEAQDTLQSIANQFLKEAVVKVRLINFRFTVLGEVKSEGTVNSYNNKISLIEAIGLAGGIDDLADRSNVKLLRTTNQQVEVQYVNILDENFLQSPYYYVHQNDVIIVPPLKQRPFRKYAFQNGGLILSSLSTLLLVINLINR